MTIETPRRTIASIQCLRGIAALMIMLLHLHLQAGRIGMAWPQLGVLTAGIDIFFVISGFIIWTTAAQRPERGPIAFWRDRLIRIVPLYWAATLLVIAVAVLAPRALQSTVFEPAHAIKSLLFIPARNPNGGDFTPILLPGWTLNYEVAFYLIFGALLAFTRPDGRRAILLCAILLAVASVPLLTPMPGVAIFYTNNIVIEFAFGVALGWLHTHGRIERRVRWWLLSAAGVALLVLVEATGVDWPRCLQLGLPALLIVAGAVLGSPVRFPRAEALGDASYSLYLTHPIVLSAAGQLWQHWQALPRLLFVPAAVLAAIAAAVLTHRLFERPVTDRLKATRPSSP